MENIGPFKLLNLFATTQLNFDIKWLLTKLELSCIRSIIPRSRKTPLKWVPRSVNQELQNHDPVGRHILVLVMYGSTPPGMAAPQNPFRSPLP